MEARPDQVPADDSLDLALPAQLELTRSLEYGQAAAYLQAAEKIVSMSTQPGASALLRIEALCEAGNARRGNGEFAGAIDVLDEAIVAAGELPDGPERDRLLALAHLRMAIIYDVTDAIVSGFEHLDCATSHFKALDDEDGLARCDMVRGALYLRLDDYERSEECYLRSLQHYRRTGETDRIGSTLSNLSVILRFAGRHDEAVAAGREAVKAAQSLLLRTTSMGNLAFALGETGQLKEALAMAREAASMLSAVGDPNYIIEYKRALAWILVREGELHEARDLLVESLATAEEKGCDARPWFAGRGVPGPG